MARLVSVTTALTLALLYRAVSAARSCANSTSPWTLSDFRYQGPDPTTRGSGPDAVVSAYLSPGRGNTLYSCIAQWPESWNGRVNGSENGALIWADCYWTGPGDNAEDSVSFAVDWKTKTFYMANSFTCSDAEMKGYVASGEGVCQTPMESQANRCLTVSNLTVVTASLALDLDNCASTAPMCFTKEIRYPLTATAVPKNTAPASATCASPPSPVAALSWRIEGYKRSYAWQPGMDGVRIWLFGGRSHGGGSTLSGRSEAQSTGGDGPSFTLRNVASGELFACKGFSGSCTASSGAAPNSVAKFTYDPATSIISVTQTWAACEETERQESSVTGTGWIQENCGRSGDIFECTSAEIFWIGAST